MHSCIRNTRHWPMTLFFDMLDVDVDHIFSIELAKNNSQKKIIFVTT
jgi:hypothetical protein